jgi:hypothetical protein
MTMADMEEPTDEQYERSRALHGEGYQLNRQADWLDSQATAAHAKADAMDVDAGQMHEHAQELHEAGDDALGERQG